MVLRISSVGIFLKENGFENIGNLGTYILVTERKLKNELDADHQHYT